MALKEIHRTEGTIGFFKGYPPTALRDATFCGVYFLTYRQIQEALTQRNGRLFHHNIVAGIMAGILATTLSHPYDLIRSRMQVRPDEFTGVLQSIRKIWRLEGRRTFFNGLVPRVMQASLSSAITWAIYEEFSAFASRDNSEIFLENS
jgi:solute carrier family 25 protein 38